MLREHVVALVHVLNRARLGARPGLQRVVDHIYHRVALAAHQAVLQDRSKEKRKKKSEMERIRQGIT